VQKIYSRVFSSKLPKLFGETQKRLQKHFPMAQTHEGKDINQQAHVLKSLKKYLLKLSRELAAINPNVTPPPEEIEA